MRRFFWGLGALLLIAVAAFFAFAPPYFEAQLNRVTPTPLPSVSAEAQALHNRLQIADMHADTLLWRRNFLEAANRGQVDLPRLQQGNVALQIFSSVTKTPKGQNYDANDADSDNVTLLAIAQMQPFKTWGSLVERSLFHARKLERAETGSNGQFRVIRTTADLDRLIADRQAGKRVVGGMLSIEGLQNLEGEITNLDVLYKAGYRMAGFTHFFDNEVAGSMHGTRKGGLTALGEQTLRRMEQMGMIVDIAHSSHAGVAQILAMAKRPVVSSHGGVQATCKVNRNLSDDEIRGVAKTGGLIGIGYWEAAICGTSPAHILRAIQHVRDLVGIDHVALGSDFDGAVTTGFDTSQLVVLTQAMLDAGFSPEDIEKVMGGNLLRVIRAGIQPLG